MQADSAPWGTYRPGMTAQALINVSRNSLLGRGHLRKLLWRLLTRVHPGPVDHRLWGERVRLFPAHNFSERKALMRPDRMDTREYALLRGRMSRPNAVFVDIGANAGLYSLHAAIHARQGSRILAIEPDAGILARFLFNLALARETGSVDPSVDVIAVGAAIGDHDGEAFLSTGGSEGSRSLMAGVGQSVTLRRLAPLLDEYGIGEVDIMKIDVEGYEDKVLPPFLASAMQPCWPRTVILEHVWRSRWTEDCVAFCQERGYHVAFKTNNNTMLELGSSGGAKLQYPQSRL